MKFFLLCLLACFVLACHSNDKSTVTSSSNLYRVSQEAELKAAIDSTYHSFSYVRGIKLDTAAISGRFIPQARIIKFENGQMQVLSVTQFSLYLNQLMTGQGLDSFDDMEIFGKTEQFGKIAHRISSYKLFVNTKDTVAQRGVNSFQLVKTNAGWRICSMIWDTENQEEIIPKYYQ